MKYYSHQTKLNSVEAFKANGFAESAEEFYRTWASAGAAGMTDNEVIRRRERESGRRRSNSVRPTRILLVEWGWLKPKLTEKLAYETKIEEDSRCESQVWVCAEFQEADDPFKTNDLSFRQALHRMNLKCGSDYYTTPHWRVVRNAKIQQAGGQICAITNRRHDHIHCHHKTYGNIGNELNHLDDLMLVLPEIHERIELLYNARSRDGSVEDAFIAVATLKL